MNNHETGPQAGPDQNAGGAVRVWDLPTRVFHWSLAALMAVAWISSEAHGDLFYIHVYSGTLLIGLVAFRLIWGFIGSRHALFSDFVRGAETVREYSRKLFSFHPPYHTGHNPLGGWMVVALLAGITLSVLSGMMSSEDGFVGRLAAIAPPGMGEAHEVLANIFGFLILLHIAGAIGHGLVSGENLPRAMVTGIKHPPAGIHVTSITPAAPWRLAVALTGAFAVLWFLWP